MRTYIIVFFGFFLCNVISLYGEGGGSETGLESSSSCRYSFCIDYLPNVIYDDENLTAVVRYDRKNGQKIPKGEQIKLIFQGEFRDHTKAVLASRAWTEQGPDQHTVHVKVKGHGPDLLKILIFAEHSKGRSTIELVAFYRWDENIPSFSVKEGTHFVLENQERLILIIRHRLYRQERRWVVLKWLDRNFKTRKDYTPLLFMGAPLTSSQNRPNSYLERLSKFYKNSTFMEFVDFPPRGGYPALINTAQFHSLEPLPLKKRVVLFWPYSDCLFGTAKREYRMCCEFVVQRLEKKGYSRDNIKILAPAVPEPLAERMQPYIDSLKEISRIYRISFSGSDELGDTDLWKFPGSKGLVIGRYPNTKGMEKIVEYCVEESTN